jgi:hypothetical protein
VNENETVACESLRGSRLGMKTYITEKHYSTNSRLYDLPISGVNEKNDFVSTVTRLCDSDQHANAIL